jgi:hypothetical protein
MLTKTMIIKISTNLKYLSCHCFKITLEDKWDHKTLQFQYNVTTLHSLGSNGVTQTTLACFLIAFVTDFGEIFFKYSRNILEKTFKT